MTNELDPFPKTIAGLQHRIEQSWNRLQTFLDSLNEAQWHLTDAVGWRIKDHLVHLAVWEEILYGRLKGQSFTETTGLDADVGKGGVEQINAVAQVLYRDLSVDEVRERLARSHTHVVQFLSILTDDDLTRPASTFDPHTTSEFPVLEWIFGDTFEHYDEHLLWMEAIVGRGDSESTP